MPQADWAKRVVLCLLSQFLFPYILDAREWGDTDGKGRRKGIKVRLKLSGVLTAAAVLSAIIGLLGGSAAQAAPVTLAARAVSSASSSIRVIPDNSIAFNLSAFGGCGKWKGTLDAYSGSGKSYENYVNVTGTLSAGCRGGVTGILWYACDSAVFQQVVYWTTETSGGTTKGVGPCSYGVSAYLELTWQGPGGYGIANSGTVYALHTEQDSRAG